MPGSKSHRRAVVSRVTAVALMLLLTHQLGACPCGCIEHNAWAQWLGLVTQDTDAYPPAHADTFRSGQDHDCTGKPFPLYVTNTKNVVSRIACQQAPVRLPLAEGQLFSSEHKVSSLNNRAPPGEKARTDRTRLQVYLL